MIIDAHIHVVPPNLPGVGVLHPCLQSPEEAADQLRRQMADAGVVATLAMGRYHGSEEDPLGIAGTLEIAAHVPRLFAVGVCDPTRTDVARMRKIERDLATGRVKALKAYLGYLHFPPDHAGFRPYYELADRFKLPVILHTGDTYSPQAKVKYAHPLLVDDVAVDHPNVRFVLAHFGNPWLRDAAEVVYKNVNVWADLSGLVMGDAGAYAEESLRAALDDLRAELQRAYRYAERPNRFLFGSDWPLATLPSYVAFLSSVIPPAHHEAFFLENASRLFSIAPR